MVDSKIFAGTVIGLLALSMIGFIPEPKDTHYCQSLNISMSCDRLSSTSSTCYPNLGTMQGKKYCESGWLKIDFSKTIPTNKIRVPLKSGGELECEVNEGVLDSVCYFNGLKQYRSEFE